MSIQYWLGVVSAEHVQRGVAGGFAQLCHGKAAPLNRMQPGDWLIYYSPKQSLDSNEKCQAFTAIGQLIDTPLYSCTLQADVVAVRRDVRYLACQPASILPLLDELSFIRDRQHWGYIFRRGHFAISAADFERIAAAMQVPAAQLGVAQEQLI